MGQFKKSPNAQKCSSFINNKKKHLTHIPCKNSTPN